MKLNKLRELLIWEENKDIFVEENRCSRNVALEKGYGNHKTGKVTNDEVLGRARFRRELMAASSPCFKSTGIGEGLAT